MEKDVNGKLYTDIAGLFDKFNRLGLAVIRFEFLGMTTQFLTKTSFTEDSFLIVGEMPVARKKVQNV